MIGWLIAATLAAILVTAVLWETFAPFIKEAVELAKAIFGQMFMFFKCYIKRVGSYIVGIVKNFLQGNRYTKETKIIPAEEVPEDISRLVGDYELDVTDNEELRLAMGI